MMGKYIINFFFYKSGTKRQFSSEKNAKRRRQNKTIYRYNLILTRQNSPVGPMAVFNLMDVLLKG